MAAVDPIHFEKAINLFPQLSETQALNCYLFATSANYNEISELRGNSPVSVKKTLEKAQVNLELHSVQSIRPVILTRIMFNSFYFIRTGKKRSSCLKTDTCNFLASLEGEQEGFRLFPELEIPKALIMCMFCSGETSRSIREAFSLTESQLLKEIDLFQRVLGINSLQTLRIVVLARLQAFLVSVTFLTN
ncbi:hypothetical protein [Cronobacter dublinensis]|uniref:hypothetical protein n=1 Tax=Cronobacter dublinensis TaxID=413497 RepID=UPI000CFB2651|nr:hypothetical protein [Cronobacter dublinensis]